MKKRTYRTVKVKQVDRVRLAEVWRGARLVVGLDVGKEEMAVSLMDQERVVRQSVKWKHPQETLEAVELLASLAVEEIAVVMESTSTYGDPVRYQLEKRGVAVYRMSTKRVRDAREVYDGVPSSHDTKSATILARLHLEGASERWSKCPEKQRELRAEVELMAVYDRQEHSHLNRLEALLGRHWPELPRILGLTSQSLASLLAEYGSPQAVSSDPAQARSLLRRVSRGALSWAKIGEILAAADSTLGVPMVDGEVKRVQGLAREVQHNRKRAREVMERIEKLVENEASALRLSQAIGVGTAAALFSRLGDPARYLCPSSYEKGLGLNLKEISSGKHQGELSITKRGPGICRWYLYLAVLRWIRSDPVVHRWYMRKVARDGGKRKQKALVALMRKLARGLWHVAQGSPLDSKKLFDAKKLGLAS